MVVEIAGFTMGQADLVRKAMAKKQPEVLAKYRKDFVKGAAGEGTPENRRQPALRRHSGLFRIRVQQSPLGRLCSHYLPDGLPQGAIIRFSTWRHIYPPFGKMPDKVSEALAECRRLRIAILAPDVNSSRIDFSIEDNAIRFGLGAIKNVGAIAAESIVAQRDEAGRFMSVGDLCRRMDWQQLNKRTLGGAG